VGEIVEYKLLKRYLRLNLRNTFDDYPLRGYERGVLVINVKKLPFYNNV